MRSYYKRLKKKFHTNKHQWIRSEGGMEREGERTKGKNDHVPKTTPKYNSRGERKRWQSHLLDRKKNPFPQLAFQLLRKDISYKFLLKSNNSFLILSHVPLCSSQISLGLCDLSTLKIQANSIQNLKCSLSN